MNEAKLPLRSRGATYSMVLGVVMGMLLAGLAVPFAFGERLTNQATQAGPTGALETASPTLTEEGSESGLDPARRAGDGFESTGATSSPGDAGAGAAPAETGTSPGVGGEPGGTVPADELTATDVGVEADSIKVGFLLIDIGNVSRLGLAIPGADPEIQRANFEAHIKRVNDRGGIHGRKIVGAFRTFDTLSQDSQREACLALTQEEKVFAVIASNGYAGPALLCVSQENATPLISDGGLGTPTPYYRLSEGRLFTMFQHGDRTMWNWAAELHAAGLLRNKTIGILHDRRADPTGKVVTEALVPRLREFGYEVAHRAELSENPSTGATQIPIAMQQMRTADVDFVLLASFSIYNTQFVQEAEAQNYPLEYSTSDWQGGYSDFSYQNMPRSFDGANGFTTYRVGEEKVGIPENPDQKMCREVYERHTGEKVPRGTETVTYSVINSHCSMFRTFAMGAHAAGPSLTREAFTQAVQSLPEVPLAMWGGGGFTPGKFDAADGIRRSQWNYDCTCWLPATDFHASRF